MTPEDWQRVKPILDSALQLDSARRPGFLKEACADPSLRHEIESLIAAHEQAGTSALNSAPFLRSTLTTGTRLGDFQILSLLGMGGMGEVYRARDLRLERDVAIKVLPRFVSLDRDRLRRFEQEAKAAAALNHPNILAVFQMGSYEGAPYLVSELLEGETLREHIKRGPVPLKKAVDYGVQIAHGFAAAHEKSIVHRDLKPENLFVTRDGRIKILDFGLAKLLLADCETQLTNQTLDTQPGAVMGTVGYMAPEQVRGLAADHRADIFAFGAILYEMLTGNRAFHKPTFADTMSAILNEDPPPVSQTTPKLPPGLERAVQRCLEKSPEQRFQSASDLAFALELSSDSSSAAAHATASAAPRTTWKWVTAAAMALAVVSGTLFAWRARSSRPLTEKDTIVLADFTNTTGDVVFDDTLRQALSIQVEQSPFLNVLSALKIHETLSLMGRPSNERITEEVAREICQRTRSTVVLKGSITQLGSQYVLGLSASTCQSGEVLAQEQTQIARKEDVLNSLGQATTKIRAKLGESLSSIQKFDAPIMEATTPSLEALKAFSVGLKVLTQKNEIEAIPFYKRAIQIDPNFAIAYASLGIAFGNLEESELANENYQKAYELRDRVSEKEKFSIVSNYYSDVTGDVERSIETSQLWAQSYPHDAGPHNYIGLEYEYLGEYEKAVAEQLAAIHLNPDSGNDYSNLMENYVALGRMDEAKKAYQQAMERGLESQFLRDEMYAIGFLERDVAEMKRQVDWAAGKQGIDDLLLVAQADTEAYYGRQDRARSLSERAVNFARQNGQRESAAVWGLSAALREAEFGNRERAREAVKKSLELAGSRRVKAVAALALASIGDVARSNALADELQKRFPQDTLLQQYWLPAARAYGELHAKKPSGALKYLEEVATHELGFPEPQFSEGGTLYPAYVRGQAYLALNRGNEAAAEFQKFIDHRTIVANFPLGALARLQLGRAYAVEGDNAKARIAYQDFLVLWKDADPDIPILKQAKAEFAKIP